jgi:hypothetical protein
MIMKNVKCEMYQNLWNNTEIQDIKSKLMKQPFDAVMLLVDDSIKCVSTWGGIDLCTRACYNASDDKVA